MSDDSEHALLNASAAVGWSTCGAYLRHNANAPRRSSKAADEGTAAHTLAAWCLDAEASPDQYPNPAIEVDGAQWPVTQEMKNAVADYLGVVRNYAKGGTLLVEQKVDYGFWILGPKPPEVKGRSWLAGGTSDAVILHDEVITIVDLKYGANPNNKVYAYDRVTDDAGHERVVVNPQLALYALGCLYEFEHLGDFKMVRMVIVQPRLEHVSTCEVDVTDLKTFALKMKAAAFRALKNLEDPHELPPEAYAPSEKGCQWCAHKHQCPALRALVETETRDLFGALMVGDDGTAPVVVEGQTMATIAAEIDPQRLADAMLKVPLMEDFLKAIRAEVERRLLAGHPVPGFKLIEGRRGPRKWSNPQAAEGVLRRKLGAAQALEPAEVISPTEAEKRLKKVDPKAYGKLLEKYVDRSEGKPSVALASDSSPALSITSVEEKFASVVLKEQLEASLALEVADDLV